MLYKEKAYTRINWKNRPNLSTPLGAKNLNKMDATIDKLDDRVIEVSSEVEKDRLNINLVSGELNALKEDVDKNTSQIKEISSLAEDVNGLKIVNTASGSPVHFFDASNMNIENIVFYGESKQNGTPTPTSPIPIEPSSVGSVSVYRKNLLKNTATSQTKNNVSFTVNSDGSVRANGTNSSATDTAFIELNTRVTLKKGSYLASIGNNDASGSTFGLVIWNVANASEVYYVYNSDARIDVEENNTSFWVRFFVAKGATVSNKTIFPMIRPSFFTDGTYEPYQSQTVNLSAPIELNGFGGVRDTDKVKKFGVVVFDGSENWMGSSYLAGRYGIEIKAKATGICMCSMAINRLVETVNCCHINQHGSFYINTSFATVDEWKAHLQSNPMTVVYELANPIETELSQADIDAIKNLHTYKPNTVVMNTADAEMDVYYVADTKAYIDKKFRELATVIVNQ